MNACKIVETIAILEVSLPLSTELITGLSYGATPYWVSGSKLYILNCALSDAAVFCKNARKEEFLWGRLDAPLGQYQLVHGKAAYVAPAADQALPPDYLNYAPPIHHRLELAAALDENRTFLSRAQHRRAATQS